jgi:hypothetical protein
MPGFGAPAAAQPGSDDKKPGEDKKT